MTKPSAFGLAVLVCVAVTGCGDVRMASVAEPSEPVASVFFSDVQVFDGVSMLPHRDVWVREGRIERVVAAGALPPPSAGLQIDGVDRTLLPGLVDSHVHLFSAGEKRHRAPTPAQVAGALLFAGITTALVAAGGPEMAALASEAAAGHAVAPHLYSSGSLSAPGGHPIPLLRAMLPWPLDWLQTRAIPVAADSAQARDTVRWIAAEMQTPFLKLFYDDLPPGSPHLSLEVLRAAVDEARRVGLRPIAHTTTAADTIEAAESGVECLMHVPQRGTLGDEQVARLAALDVPVVSTVRLLSASRELGDRGPTALERSIVDPVILEIWQREPAWALPGFSEEIDRSAEQAAADTRANFRKLLRAGVRIFVGTDSGVHGVFPGAALHLELQTLVELGMPPLQALRAATSDPAAFLEPGGSFGRIAPGQRADLLLVRGDPSRDIAALSSIEGVFLEGRPLERHGL